MVKKQRRKPSIVLSAVMFGLTFFLCAAEAPADVADYVGTYSGTYTGDDTGIYRCIVETDGTVETISWSTLGNMANWAISTIDANGNFTASSAYWGYVYVGSIDEDGNITGTYASESENVSGTFTGQRVTPESISQYVGDYAGTITGDDSGVWSGTIYPDGMMRSSDDGAEGCIGPDGKFIVINSVDTGFYGIIDQNGDVSGYWHNPFYETSGLITGRRVDDDDDDDNDTGSVGGGGGGCFIITVCP